MKQQSQELCNKLLVMVQVFQTDMMACHQPAIQTAVNRSKSELLLILGGRSSISKLPAYWSSNAARFLYHDMLITDTDDADITYHTTADRDPNIPMFLNVTALWLYLPVS
jgi:hypothetical protein